MFCHFLERRKSVNLITALLCFTLGIPVVHAQSPEHSPLPGAAITVFPRTVSAPPGIAPQLGFGAGKLLEAFHLPPSPNELQGFILEYFLKQKLGNTLPLNLNANNAYLTVENGQLPGGPFRGKPLNVSAMSLRSPLAPGDYIVPVMAYCTQYSVHRPGQGTAYKLAPVEGTQAEAISTLLWRGTFAGKSPQELQATDWAIQSGMPYGSLPKPYQATIDQLIPEYKDKLKGNTLDVVQSTYADITTDPRKYVQTYLKQRYNKTIPLMLLPKIAVPAPPLEQLLGKMGPAGHLMLDAKKQSNIFLTAYTTQERGEQVLFAGQGEALPPEPASEGPWTVRVPGVAYVRFKIQGGNMQGNNLLEVRILSQTNSAFAEQPAKLVLAGYSVATSAPTAIPPISVFGLLGVKSAGDSLDAGSLQTLTASGVIGYSQGGGGAQAQIPVVYGGGELTGTTALPKVTIKKVIYENIGQGACIYLGATIERNGSGGKSPRLQWVQQVKADVAKREEGKPSCPTNVWYYDPCNKDSGYENTRYYRPVDQQNFNKPELNKFPQFAGFDSVFRDFPHRDRGQKVEWQANLQLVMEDSEANLGYRPLAQITYGFKVDQTGETLQPLFIDDVEKDSGSQTKPGFYPKLIDQCNPDLLDRHSLVIEKQTGKH